MLQDIATKFELVIKRLKGHGKLTEKNIADTMREMRRVLLEADVNYKVAKEFVEKVRQKALGTEVLRSVTPGQLVVKIIHDELTELMGSADAPLMLSGSPSAIMLVGLQGSGKTTCAGKLARYLLKKGRNPLLVAADTQRPAAVQQIEIVGKAVGARVISGGTNTVEICKNATRTARKTCPTTSSRVARISRRARNADTKKMPITPPVSATCRTCTSVRLRHEG